MTIYKVTLSISIPKCKPRLLASSLICVPPPRSVGHSQNPKDKVRALVSLSHQSHLTLTFSTKQNDRTLIIGSSVTRDYRRRVLEANSVPSSFESNFLSYFVCESLCISKFTHPNGFFTYSNTVISKPFFILLLFSLLHNALSMCQNFIKYSNNPDTH